MRKIKEEDDNPIDNILIDLCELISPFIHRLGLTPNMITTISLFFGLATAWLLYKRQYLLACISWTAQYFFDCLDGYIARKYDQVTVFGDYYDHISDIVKLSVVLFVLYRISPIKFYRVLVVLTIFGILMIGHMGCQEKEYDKEDESGWLSLSKTACPNSFFKDVPSTLQYTKYFGYGTFNLVVIFGFLYYAVGTK
jgi:phosphatidylglycerophosphate synthase